MKTGAWAANILFFKKIVPPSCVSCIEKGVDENVEEERGLMEKSSQKKQHGKGFREPAGITPWTGEGEVFPLRQEWVRIRSLYSEEGKSEGSKLIVSLQKLEARLE